MKLFLVVSILFILTAAGVSAGPFPSASSPAVCTECTPRPTSLLTAPYLNIWHGLTDAEVLSVTKFLTSNSSNLGLNITLAPDPQTQNSTAGLPSPNSTGGTAGTNTLLLVELLLPNKTDALAYLEGKAPPPPRFAHAILDIRTTKTAYIQDFVVGPLPISPRTTVNPLNYPYNHGGRVKNTMVKGDTSGDWLTQVAVNMSDITMKLWGLKMAGDANDTLAINVYGVGPVEEEGRLIAWNQFSGVTGGAGLDTGTLLPLGLYIRYDLTGDTADDWEVTGVLYNSIFYHSLSSFRAAIHKPGFIINGANTDGDWTSTDRSGPPLLEDERFPPIPVAPAGSRYKIDAEKMYVEWMDFSFYIAFSRDTGVRLFDLRYRGERIVYELGIMEAMAVYAGNDPVQSGTAFFDSLYGLGVTSFRLLPGFDCPTYATFLNTTTHTPQSTPSPGSICIFETDGTYPLFRHTQNYIAAAKNVFLTLRSISTVGNYDYMLDYTFYTDGSIQVEARASGYIRTAYYAGNGEYGYRIHDNLSGSMHDHVLNFKLDLDILGTANTVATSEFVPTTEKYPWSSKPVNTFKLRKSFLESEDEAGITWHPNAAKSYAVVNKEHKNRYGEYRGYKIRPLTPGIVKTVKSSKMLGKAATWAERNLWVTKRKDSEASCCHPYASLDVNAPPVVFEDYLDGEKLVQEDLVLWFNIGMHHAPSTGDLPTTTFTSANGGVRIEPMNYFLNNPGKRTRQMVRVGVDGAGKLNVTTFGAQEMGRCSVRIIGTTEGWSL